jgi:hypothetical protein
MFSRQAKALERFRGDLPDRLVDALTECFGNNEATLYHEGALVLTRGTTANPDRSKYREFYLADGAEAMFAGKAIGIPKWAKTTEPWEWVLNPRSGRMEFWVEARDCLDWQGLILSGTTYQLYLNVTGDNVPDVNVGDTLWYVFAPDGTRVAVPSVKGTVEGSASASDPSHSSSSSESSWSSDSSFSISSDPSDPSLPSTSHSSEPSWPPSWPSVSVSIPDSDPSWPPSWPPESDPPPGDSWPPVDPPTTSDPSAVFPDASTTPMTSLPSYAGGSYATTGAPDEPLWGAMPPPDETAAGELIPRSDRRVVEVWDTCRACPWNRDNLCALSPESGKDWMFFLRCGQCEAKRW